jgi:tetratricopeptide (TPR) repeat protein
MGLSNSGPIGESDEANLRYAASQHEILSILLNEGQFDEILPEFNKILALDLGGENEILVAKETWQVAEQLVSAGQHSLAHGVVDASLAKMTKSENQFTLLMLKGKIYREEGLLDEAISVYRKAQDLKD